MAAYESIDVIVLDDTPQKNPIEGVLIRVFDENGTIFYLQATTDATGVASFMLPAPSLYQIRLYKFQVSIEQPQFLQVLEDVSNVFEIYGHVFSPPEALDPRLCRCSGFFRGPNGAPAPYVDIQIIAKFDPVLLEGDAMLTERLTLKTDASGYVQTDLVRFAEYDVTLQGYEGCLRHISVPDRPSVNFPDLLFPVVDSVIFDVAGPYAIGVGSDAELIITPTVYASDGNVLEGTAIEDVAWSIEDPSIACVFPTTKTLTLRGLRPGYTNLLASRKDKSIVRIPNTPISGVPVAITVA